MTASRSVAPAHGRRSELPSTGETRGHPGAGNVLALARQWREQAVRFREYSATTQALVLEKCAEELEHSVGEWQSELLTLTAAAQVSGYSADHLGRLVREGKIPNRGRSGAPKVARGDIPMKHQPLPEAVAPGPVVREISRTAIVQSIIDQGVA